jgi:hypothetical protein
MPREAHPLPPVVYDNTDVVFPAGTILGDPDAYTYRILWSQVLPSHANWWPPEIFPIVTCDRSILLKHGYGKRTAYGVSCILSILALQTPQLCCINIRSQTYAKAYNLWWYARVTDEEIRTIEWSELARDECDQLTAAVQQDPLRSLVGGRSSEGRRAPVIYRYPAREKPVQDASG